MADGAAFQPGAGHRINTLNQIKTRFYRMCKGLSTGMSLCDVIINTIHTCGAGELRNVNNLGSTCSFRSVFRKISHTKMECEGVDSIDLI